MTSRAPGLGIDVGGTFTDFIAADGRVRKLPSSRTEPGSVLHQGMVDLGLDRATQLVIAHGTTVATNAVLESDLPPTGLLITRGFRDILSLGRQNRPGLYDLEPRPHCEPIDDRLIAEVEERVAADGSILVALDLDGALKSARRLIARGAQAIAICFLNSYVAPEHEVRLAAALREEGIAVTSSSELAPEFREFERFSTAYVNAALMPLLANYSDDLTKKLALADQKKRRLLVIQSDGGVLDLKQAAEEPVRLVLSGPAGGLVGAWQGASTPRRQQIVTFDMGGTSTDVALMDGGPSIAASAIMAGRPLLVPCLDIHTVGAGGGSIAHVDSGGLLKVGPASAGAEPGPAAYGRGGPATVTDAHVHLGRIPMGQFLGGEFQLDLKAAKARMMELARALKLTADRAALGVLAVAEATMERALRRISLERGHDPRRFALVAFGGAGGLHAAALGASLEMPEVVIPRDPGLLSARGMLQARIRREYSRTVLGVSLGSVEKTAKRHYRDFESRAQKAMKAEGLLASDIQLDRLVDLRYRGQSYELSVALAETGQTAQHFHDIHEQRYGFARREAEVELVALRLRAMGPTPRLAPYNLARGKKSPVPIDEQRVVFEDHKGLCPIYRRDDLGRLSRVDGPAIIVEYSSTIVVPPGHDMRVEESGALVIRRRG